MAIKIRGKVWQLYKRVPARYRTIEPRTFFWLSLHTDSRSAAEQKAPAAWDNMIEAWEARLAGDTLEAEQRFEAARELAAIRGFRFMRSDQVAKLPVGDLVKRVEAIGGTDDKPDLIDAAAILGGATEPVLTISRALEIYWTLTGDQKLGKSDDQVRRWENPRKKAIQNLIDVIGDKGLNAITGDDMLDFRLWWQDRLEAGGLTANSANKDLGHIGSVLKTVNKMKRLSLVLPLSDLAFKNGEAKQRPPFSDSWIRDKIMCEGALDGLNVEARCILLAMINTGARPSELAALTADQIKLDSNVPHISIEAIDRQLKSANARRVIPLCGVSLEAMRKFPQGFPRYRSSPASLSATVNKYLRENGLLETPRHSLYGLRHSFEDRQLGAEVDERIRRDLMGHALKRERYGKGASLEHLLSLVQATAL